MTDLKPHLSGANPRVIRYERKRLALLGNQRALKHGRYTAAAKAERLARTIEFWQVRELQALAWGATDTLALEVRRSQEAIRERQEIEAAEARREADLKLALSPRSRKIF